MPSEYKQQVVDYKYAQLPEDTKYKKKKKKKQVKRSDHKHIYVPCYFNYNTYIYVNHKKIWVYVPGTYCPVCGRIGDRKFDSIPIEKTNPNWPVFKKELLDLNKYVGEQCF